jgi:hypothetical protein
MSNVPIIGQAKTTQDPDAVNEPKEVMHAFLVVQHADGSWQGLADYQAPVKAALSASTEDMASGCHAIGNAIHANQIAALVMHYQMQTARQVQEQMQNQQLMAGLDLK